jgi:ABC-type amino acid transport substrate-binding protein
MTLQANTIASNNSATFTFTADVTPPVLNSATALTATQLDVHFSEDVDLTTSQTVTNYVVDNSIGSPTSSQRDATDFSLVHLIFANSFADGINNTLTVNNVKDLAGNTINANSTTTFTYATPSSAVPFDVVINEFMADPDPVNGLPDVEYVEIYNRSNKTIDLKRLETFGFRISA